MAGDRLQILNEFRPRGGDFLYSPEELTALETDVEAIREAGAYGIATGLLTKAGTVDVPGMERIMESAGSLSVTFHRAFDMTRDPVDALEELLGLSVSRILTSGQERSALDGLPLIRELVQVAGDRISILPGGGIGEGNVQELVRETGVREVHFTAFSSLNSGMTYRNTRPLMGGDRVPGEFERLVTDPERVRRIREKANASP